MCPSSCSEDSSPLQFTECRAQKLQTTSDHAPAAKLRSQLTSSRRTATGHAVRPKAKQLCPCRLPRSHADISHLSASRLQMGASPQQQQQQHRSIRSILRFGQSSFTLPRHHEIQHGISPAPPTRSRPTPGSLGTRLPAVITDDRSLEAAFPPAVPLGRRWQSLGKPGRARSCPLADIPVTVGGLPSWRRRHRDAPQSYPDKFEDFGIVRCSGPFWAGARSRDPNHAVSVVEACLNDIPM
ncbi:hypothetical protein B0T11DRAFT_269789 [Plectosphaerella cucumerina]|uniref:Uncharacterized protein n=1 Tax=Plectosphaerella cucumerina TaxID=40658 RepID=A0A8K0X7T0_9PEZI|nr:hypothetical protein B0T11DRAFT_269789 [Plectosphaerella cucumerina]